jgi:hypothetical protein
MSYWALVVAAAITVLPQTQDPPSEPARNPPQEVKPIPKDSVEIVTTGCLKGRVFTSIGAREAEGPVRGPDVTGRSFRLAGPRPVMEEVKRNNGRLVEVTGLVRRSALTQSSGMRVGKTGVVIGAPPPSSDPLGMSMRSPNGGLVVMDASSVQFLDTSCPIAKR